VKGSIQATVYIGAVFALVCLGVAVNGFLSLDDIADAAQRSDALGFASFWAFLGAVGAGLGVLAWWITRGDDDQPEA
jgi:NADH:ubiquinone oxidoreductase subunit 6 (subunit J)